MFNAMGFLHQMDIYLDWLSFQQPSVYKTCTWIGCGSKAAAHRLCLHLQLQIVKLQDSTPVSVALVLQSKRALTHCRLQG